MYESDVRAYSNLVSPSSPLLFCRRGRKVADSSNRRSTARRAARRLASSEIAAPCASARKSRVVSTGVVTARARTYHDRKEPRRAIRRVGSKDDARYACDGRFRGTAMRDERYRRGTAVNLHRHGRPSPDVAALSRPVLPNDRGSTSGTVAGPEQTSADDLVRWLLPRCAYLFTSRRDRRRRRLNGEKIDQETATGLPVPPVLREGSLHQRLSAGTTKGRRFDAVSREKAMLRGVQMSKVQTQMDVGQQLGKHGARMHQVSRDRLPAQTETAGETGRIGRFRSEQGSSAASLPKVQDPWLLLPKGPVAGYFVYDKAKP